MHLHWAVHPFGSETFRILGQFVSGNLIHQLGTAPFREVEVFVLDPDTLEELEWRHQRSGDQRVMSAP